MVGSVGAGNREIWDGARRQERPPETGTEGLRPHTHSSLHTEPLLEVGGVGRPQRTVLPRILSPSFDLGPGSWGPSVVGWGRVGIRILGPTSGPGRRGEKAGHEGKEEEEEEEEGEEPEDDEKEGEEEGREEEGWRVRKRSRGGG